MSLSTGDVVRPATPSTWTIGPTLDELRDLNRAMGDRDVLSVYLSIEDGADTHPTRVRLRLADLINRVRAGIDADADGASASFGDAAGLIEGLFDESSQPAVGTHALFAVEGGPVWHRHVEAILPDWATYATGAALAPLVGLAPEAPIAVAIVDRKHARVFKVVGGRISEVDGVVPSSEDDDLTDVGVAKRASTTSGVRGQTAQDQVQRTRATQD